jgi:hypothetical protein
MAHRAVGRVIQAQGLLTVTLGALIGIPLGVAGGRTAWRAYAGELDVVTVGVVPVPTVALVVLAAGLLALVVAVLPARTARRAPVGTLRPE